MAKISDFRDDVTNKIIEALEKGTAPWQIPWNGREAPQNAITKHQYSGINLHILALKTMTLDEKDRIDPRWCTFKQAQDNNCHIKKGEHGTQVLLWKPQLAAASTGQTEIIAVLQKVFTVFHASQIEGLPDYNPPEENIIEKHEKAEKLIADEDYIPFLSEREFHSRSLRFTTSRTSLNSAKRAATFFLSSETLATASSGTWITSSQTRTMTLSLLRNVKTHSKDAESSSAVSLDTFLKPKFMKFCSLSRTIFRRTGFIEYPHEGIKIAACTN